MHIGHCLAGIISIAGYMPGTNKFKLTEGLENLPILHLHGHSDDVIHYEWALMTKEFLLSKVHQSPLAIKLTVYVLTNCVCIGS
jgi:predicted esterase